MTVFLHWCVSAWARSSGLDGAAADEAGPARSGNWERPHCYFLYGQHRLPSTSASPGKHNCVILLDVTAVSSKFETATYLKSAETQHSQWLCCFVFFLLLQEFDPGASTSASQLPTHAHAAATLSSESAQGLGAKPKSGVSQEPNVPPVCVKSCYAKQAGNLLGYSEEPGVGVSTIQWVDNLLCLHNHQWCQIKHWSYETLVKLADGRFYSWAPFNKTWAGTGVSF